MIVRIFRVIVHSELHKEFEDKFRSTSIPFVRSHEGLVSVSVGRPTKWSLEEYVMISTWESEDALVKFAGEKWTQAVIPQGMEKYVKQCWVHHYEVFD
jgi:heme oxygenase (mycobilin-producing)